MPLMPMARIEIPTLTVRVTGPMHIGTGFARGLVNRTVVRGRDGLVYVPGSTLKGKVRDACQALARLHEVADCSVPFYANIADHREKCLVCRIFGAPSRPSTLRWQSAHLTEDWVNALHPDPESRAVLGQTTTRTQVQLSRARGLASEGRLYTSEFAAEGLTFEANPALTGHLSLTPMRYADEPDVYYELVLLLAGMKMIGALGGGVSRGAGQCTLDLPLAIQVDGNDIPIQRQLNYIEALRLYRDEAKASL